ncbi:MAG: hypothetical protein ACX94C_07755 [Phycisphaerales bacterium]
MKAILATLVMFAVIGCANQTITQRYQTGLRQLTPGQTTVDEFNRIMPEAELRGQTTYNGDPCDVYQVSHRDPEDADDGRYTAYLWFYFRDGKLLKWGRPSDWNNNADLTVEVRDR